MGARRPVSILLALVTAGIVSAQEPPPSPPPQPAPSPAQQPTAPVGPNAEPPRQVIRRGINFVSVDVIVTDKQGNPVIDLTPEDFDVFENTFEWLVGKGAA